MIGRRAVVLAAPALLLGAGAARAATVLKVGDQRGGVQALTLAAGVLEGVPYRVEWSEFPAAAPVLEALNAGAIDVGYVGDGPFTFGFGAGIPMKVISAVRTNQAGLAVIVPKDSPIRTTADLAGRRIATGRGSIGHLLLLAAIEAGKLPAGTKPVFMLPADARAALAGGSIDAWSTWEPYISQAELLEGARRVLTGEGLTPGQSYLTARETALKDKREELADFVRRVVKARAWRDGHLTEFADGWAKLMNFPPSVPEQWFARAAERTVPMDQETIANQQRVVDIYVRGRLLPERFDAARAFDTSFNAAVG